MSECSLCKKRGQTWSGSAPKCGFSSGAFNADNWNCATLNALRGLCERKDSIGERWRINDISFGVLPFFDGDSEFGGYIVLSWYKDRGRCGQAYFFCDDDVSLLTIEQAETAIRCYKSLT